MSLPRTSFAVFFFFFNDAATTEIYTLSLHDALPICLIHHTRRPGPRTREHHLADRRSEEHTSELQSRFDLVCRLLLEKKKTYNRIPHIVRKEKYKKIQTTCSNFE